MNAASLRILQAMPTEAKELILSAQGNEIVDALAEIREVEKKLASVRQSAASEVEGHTSGTNWKVEIPRQGQRSFNFATILPKFADAMDASMIAALRGLVDSGALKLSWSVKALEQFAYDHDITLITAPREITDGDLEDIGVVWTDGYPRYERISPAAP
jgi:hypothetical protein